MTELLLTILALIGVGCAFVLAQGGRYGHEASNPWWFVLSGASVLLSAHAIGFALPEAAWLPWVAIGIALGGSVLAGLRELSFWTQELLPRPGNREFIMEVVLIVTGVVTANAVQPSLPGVHRITTIAVVLIPLLMVRWAATRLVRPGTSRGR